jgi:hypothetical protein
MFAVVRLYRLHTDHIVRSVAVSAELLTKCYLPYFLTQVSFKYLCTGF